MAHVPTVLRRRGRPSVLVNTNPAGPGCTSRVKFVSSTGDVPAVLAGMDPKIEWTEAEGWPLYSGTLVGPQAIVDGVFMRLGEIGANFSVNIAQLVAEGDTVVGLGTYTWNRKGSGEPAEVKIAHVWTLDNGKVTRFQQHVDTAKERYLIA